MRQLQKKLDISPGPPAGYAHHLPDKPWPTSSYITYEEFFDWADEDTLAEWVDGRIEMSSPANWKHQQIAGLLYKVFDTFVEMSDLGVILQNPFQMKLPGKKGSGREPDVMFVAKANLSRMESGLLRGAADLAVEVTSPESETRDRHAKFIEYAAGAVPEYWIIDPDHQAEFYLRNQQGQYERQPLDEQGRYHSQALPGFWLKPEWLWREPLPNAVLVLKTVCGPAYQAYLAQNLQSSEEL